MGVDMQLARRRRVTDMNGFFRLPNQVSDPAAACVEPGPVEENGVPQTGNVPTDEDHRRIVENHKNTSKKIVVGGGGR